MLDNEKNILKLFNEKVEKLDRLNFTKFVREKSIGFSVTDMARAR